MNSAEAFSAAVAATRSELAKRRRAGLLKCFDCPCYDPLEPMGPRYRGLGLCLFHGVEEAYSQRGCTGACAAFIAEVDDGE